MSGARKSRDTSPAKPVSRASKPKAAKGSPAASPPPPIKSLLADSEAFPALGAPMSPQTTSDAKSGETGVLATNPLLEVDLAKFTAKMAVVEKPKIFTFPLQKYWAKPPDAAANAAKEKKDAVPAPKKTTKTVTVGVTKPVVIRDLEPELPKVVEPVSLQDIHKMPRPERRALLAGDVWAINVGGKEVYRIYKNLLMTVSAKAQEVYKANQKAKSIDLPAGMASKLAIHYLMDWCVDTCLPTTAFRIKKRDSFIENLAVIRAARVLGMLDIVTNMANGLGYQIRTSFLTFDEMTAVQDCALNKEDPLFCQLALRMAHLRYTDELRNPEKFEKYLSTHPKLRNAMVEIDQQYAAKRLEREQERIRIEEERAAKKEAYERHLAGRKRQQAKKEGQLLESLKQELNGQNGGSQSVRVISAEQAAVLRRRSL